MHADTIVRQLLRTATPGMHAVRREALLCTVRSALGGSALSVTALGRGLSIRGGEKHDIKRVDRLLSNRHLSDEAFEVYAALARRALAGATSALVSVDWSPLDPAKRHFLLRASVSLDGRAMTLYEEVHALSRFEKRATKRALHPKAKTQAETGDSTDPMGVDGDRVPTADVGEYCPLVRP